MKKILLITFIFLSIPFSQCENLSQLQYGNNFNCEWIIDIQSGNCNNLGFSSCDANPNCYGAYTNPGWYYGWYCAGGYYQINNSYCQEIQNPECSELNQDQCNHPEYGENCNWSENIENNSCSNYFSQTHCDSMSRCNWESVCTSWGSWYTWICYEYGYECTGTYEVDNGFCEDSEFILGDVNQDYIINVMDIMLVVNLILDNELELLADLNDDHLINVIDIIMIVNIILEG